MRGDIRDGIMSTGGAWTTADDATLVRLACSGVSSSQAAKALGRSRNAVLGRAYRKHLQFKGHETRPAVRQARPVKQTDKAGRSLIERFSTEEDQEIVRMSALGKSGNDIAKVLDRTKSSVTKRARRLGAPLCGKDGPKKPPAPKPATVKTAKQHLHPGNIAGKKEGRQHDPEFRHVSPRVAVVPLMVALVDLAPEMCRFPVAGDRADTLFCGHPKEQASYCRSHARLAYQRPEDRRRAA